MQIFNNQRKFIVQLASTDSYSPLKYFQCADQLSLEQNLLINFILPDLLLFCDKCQSLLQKNQPSILTGMKQNSKQIFQDLCIKCFCHTIKQNKLNTGQYYVRTSNQFSLIDQDWKGSNQILFLNGILKYGYGNWSDIISWMQTNQCFIYNQYENHILKLMNEEAIFKQKDCFHQLKHQKRIYKRPYYLQTTFQYKENKQDFNKDELHQTQAESDNIELSINKSNKLSNLQDSKSISNLAHLSIYTPQRNQFILDYDPYAQSLIANLQFTQNDAAQQVALKQALLIQYNQKLRERNKRKNFALKGNIIPVQKCNNKNKYMNSQNIQDHNIFAGNLEDELQLKKIIQSSRKYVDDEQEIEQITKQMNKYITLKVIKQSYQKVQQLSKQQLKHKLTYLAEVKQYAKFKINSQIQEQKDQLNNSLVKKKCKNVKQPKKNINNQKDIKKVDELNNRGSIQIPQILRKNWEQINIKIKEQSEIGDIIRIDDSSNSIFKILTKK